MTTKFRYWAPVLLLLTGWLTWRGILDNGFVYDDEILVVRNAHIRTLTPPAKFFRVESQYEGAQSTRHTWRPLSVLAYALTYKASGMNPRAFHAVDLSLHLLNTLLIFALFLSLFESEAAAFTAAAVFLLHPAQCEAVAWIGAGSSLLYLAFYLLALLALIRSNQAMSLALLGLSLLSKETAISFPVVAALVLYRRHGGFKLKSLVPHVMLIGAYAAARSWTLGKTAQTGYWAGSAYAQILTMTKGLASYIKLALIPNPLSLEYLFAVKRTLDTEVFLYALIAATLLLMGALLAKRSSKAGWGILLFFAALLPVSNIIPINTIINERYLYLSLAGLGLVVGEIAERGRARRALVLASLCACIALTYSRIQTWKDDFSLAEANLMTCPQSARLHYMMGKALAQRSQWDKAIKEYRLALAIELERTGSLGELDGIDPLDAETLAQAALYRRGLQTAVNRAEAFLDIGSCYLQKGNFTRAILYFERSAPPSGRDLAGLPAVFGRPYAMRFGSSTVASRPLFGNPVSGRARRGLVLYSQAFRDTTVFYAASPGQIEEFYLLKSRQAPKRFSQKLEPSGDIASFRLDAAGRLEAIDRRGSALLRLSRPLVIDAAGKTVAGDFTLAPGKNPVLTLAFNDRGLRYPILIDPAWTVAGGSSLNTARQQQTATLLPDGRVLVTGGLAAGGLNLSTSEIYDPTAGTWTNAASMSVTRRLNHAVLLANGNVLVAGGETTAGVADSTSELYDPVAGTWGLTGSMSAVRRGHTATLLGNGKVLVTGGDNGAVPLSSADLYDPGAGTWAATGNMGASRSYHSAILLANGKVLVSGGLTGAGATYLSTSEIYDPGTGTWSATGSLPQALRSNTMTQLPNGKILSAGGNFGGTVALSSAALYDMNAGTWSIANSLAAPRANHTSTLLPNGKVLVTGGLDDTNTLLSTAEIYDPATGNWTAAGSMSDMRKWHTATLLPGGKVLIAAGANNSGAAATAELYDPGVGAWSAEGGMTVKRLSHGMVLLPTGVVLAVGGSTGGTTLATSEYYNVAGGTWTASGTMHVARLGPALVLLPNGRVLVAGGGNSTAELYNAGVWAYTGSMQGRDGGFTATLLPGGKLLAAGGTLSAATVSTAEIYDPLSEQWLAVGSMTGPRSAGHGAVLLPGNKKVLVFGGTSDGITVLSTAELYDPNAGTWAATGSMGTPRTNSSVSLLPNGKVLVVGGRSDATTFLASAEIYDPNSGTWSAAGALGTARENAAVWALREGKILVVGGDNPVGSAVTTAELYDPASNAWAAAASPLISGAGWNAGSAMLPDGTLLMSGGSNSPGNAFSTAQLLNPNEFDFALSTKSFVQPKIATIAGSATFPVTLGPGNTYNVTGTTFTGIGGGSGGSYSAMSSPTNYPRAYLMPLNRSGGGAAAIGGNVVDVSSTVYGAVEQTIYQNGTSSTTFNITLPADLQCGYYRFFAVANAIPSTATVVKIAPLAPGLTPVNAGAPFSGITTSTIAFQWNSSGEAGVDGYLAQASTAASFSVAVATVGTALGQTNALYAGLAPNTTYFFRAAADNCGGAGAFAGTLATSTLANVVTAMSFTQVFPTSATVHWSIPSAEGYLVVASTASNFSGTLFSAATGYGAATSLTVTGLSSGTAYNFQVGSLNWNQTPNFASAGSTTTTLYPGTLGGVPYSAVFSTGLTANWVSGFAPGTSYYAELSTGAFPNSFAGNLSSSTYNQSADFSGLLPNATYFAQISTNPIGASPIPLGSTTTLANVPLSLAAVLSSTGAALNWGGNANPAYTQYSAQLSTNNFATVNASSVTLSTAAAFGALIPNSTYYFRVRALNISGGGTAFAALAATATLAAVPSSAAPSAVGATSMTINWLANGNPGYTLYSVQISTDNLATLVASALTSGTTAAFTGLSPNTSYYAQIQAVSVAGAVTTFTAVSSTMTLPFQPAAAIPPFLTVDIASATLQWSANGNQPGVVYTARISTNGFATVNASSVAVSTSALFNALAPNTTHYFQVKAANALNETAFVFVGSTITLAAAPAATALTTVLSNSATVSWSANANPSGTQYEIWRDVSAAFPAPVKAIVSTTNYQSTGLTPNTGYFFQVRAINGAGLFSPFDSTASTTTLATPGTPGAPVPTALGISSISWTWSSAATALSYKIFKATSPASLIASTPTLSFVYAGLSTNTAYGIVVGGFNGTLGPLSPAATLYTLAMPPGGSTMTAVSLTSATVAWSLNTNPTATTAEIQRSSNNINFTTLITTVATSYLDYSLAACSTYYYRVRNQNGNGAATAFDVTVLVATLPTIPRPAIAFAAVPIAGNRVALSWTSSPTPGVSGYRLYSDAGTGAVNYASPLAVFASSETSYTTGVLASSASYRFALRTLHACGNEETAGTFASSGAQALLVGVRAAIKTPDSGKRITGNRVTVIAELVSGSIADVAEILIQFKPSSATAWSTIFPANVNHPNPATQSPYLVQWNVTGWPAVSYDLRAVAISGSGIADPAPTGITVSVDPANPDIAESVDGTGKVLKTQLIDPAVANTISTSGSGADDPVTKVLLPAGSITGSTLTVTLESNPSIATAPPAGFETMVSGLQIQLSNQQTVLPNGMFAILTMSYPASVIDPNKLQIYSMSETSGVWSRDIATVIDQANRTVTGFTPHFSFFGIFLGGAPAPDLTGIRSYPVPWKPNGSNPDEGKPFNPTDPTSGIIFENLPSIVTIRIYTLSGRQVARFDTKKGAGAVQWDGRNEDGRDVASGVYFAIFETPGAKSVVKKLAIIR